MKLGSMFGDSITQAREAAMAEKKLQSVLASTGGAVGFSADELKAYAGELQGVTSFEDDAIVNSMALLATFKGINGANFKGATDAILDLSAVMGTDLDSSAKLVGKALSDPVKGITKLGKLGVSFTDQQKGQIKQMTAVGDVAGAQKVILDQLGNTYGGAAKAMADPLVQVKNKFGDLLELIGGAMGPALTAIAGGLGKAIDWLGAKMPMIVKVVRGYLAYVATSFRFYFGLAAQAFTWLWGYVGPIVAAIGAWVKTHWTGMAGVVGTAGATIQGFTTTTFGAIWSIISTVAGWIGAAVMATWNAVVSVWNWATGSTVASTTSMGDMLGKVWSGIVSAVTWMANAVKVAFWGVEFGIQNWKAVLELAMVGAAYSVVKFANEVVYFFGTVVPGYLSWFSNNWRDIFKTMADFTASVFTNIGKNIVNFFKAVKSWMSGKGFNFKWTGLTEGFESSIKELPNIAERQIGGLEKSLGGNVDDLQKQLGGKWDEFVKNKQKDADAITQGIVGGVTGMAGAINGAMGEVAKPLDIPVPKMPVVEQKIDAVVATKQADAIMAGSAEGQRLRYSGGKGMVDFAKKQLDETKRGNDTLEEIRDAIEDGAEVADF
ncbi:MAG: phage tail length tape measure family protein [Planctomycetes bacterium]|nr:phage tail length tape measure family protein [Planctomycetota bacterium]